MIKRTFAGVVLLVTLLVPGMASAQAPSPDALATARELVAVSRAAESAKQMLPAIVKLLKPAIVQSRWPGIGPQHAEQRERLLQPSHLVLPVPLVPLAPDPPCHQ